MTEIKTSKLETIAKGAPILAAVGTGAAAVGTGIVAAYHYYPKTVTDAGIGAGVGAFLGGFLTGAFYDVGIGEPGDEVLYKGTAIGAAIGGVVGTIASIVRN